MPAQHPLSGNPLVKFEATFLFPECHEQNEVAWAIGDFDYAVQTPRSCLGCKRRIGCEDPFAELQSDRSNDVILGQRKARGSEFVCRLRSSIMFRAKGRADRKVSLKYHLQTVFEQISKD